MGALVKELTRPAILDAIRQRRTYALTGDRIELDFLVNGSLMGSDIDAGETIDVEYCVKGRDEIESVEVIQDGIVVHRSFGIETASPEEAFAGPFQVRLEWGWGPWASLELARTTDWKLDLRIQNGKILRYFPCLSSGPFDEDRRHLFRLVDDTNLAIQSYTSRKGAYRENPNQSVVLEILGDGDTVFNIQANAPSSMKTQSKAGVLFGGSQAHHMGPFPSESYLWHRILPANATTIVDKCTLPIKDAQSNVYMRVKEKNGHMAWSSPVYVNYR
jgi:hypothetical protein